MSKCKFCGVEIELPFQCNYCGEYFCEAHRLLENHNCPNAPPRTPLGSYQAKQMLASTSRKKELTIASQNVSVADWKVETNTDGNIFNHRFVVPLEVYSDKKYREKLDKARTLNEVDNILHDYYKHHPKKK